MTTTTTQSATNTIHRTDNIKPGQPIRSDVGVLITNPKQSCYRCSQFSHDVRKTKHAVYRYMCPTCRDKIFPIKPTQPTNPTNPSKEQS